MLDDEETKEQPKDAKPEPGGKYRTLVVPERRTFWLTGMYLSFRLLASSDFLGVAPSDASRSERTTK